MTALSTVLPRGVVEHITKSNELFPGLHGTRDQLRALWDAMEHGQMVVADDHLDSGLQMHESVPQGHREVHVWIETRRFKKTKRRAAKVVFEMKVVNNTWYRVTPSGMRPRCLLNRLPRIHREVAVDVPESERLEAFRQVLIDFSQWHSTLHLCGTCTPRAVFCGGRTIPGSTKCAECVLRAGFKAKRKAKRQRLE